MNKKYDFTADPFGRAFMENPDLTIGERIGLGMIEAAKYQPIEFPENCMLPTVRTRADQGATGYSFGTGIFHYLWVYDYVIDGNSDHKKELEEIKAEMAHFSTAALCEENTPENLKRFRRNHVCWGGFWCGHSNPSFGKIARLGTDGIRREIEAFREKNPDKGSFYNSCKYAMDSLDVLGDKARKIAEDKALTEDNFEKKTEWERIAKAFSSVPRNPAKDFHEAIMAYWLLYSVDGIDSPGRFDMEMIDFYEKSEESDRLKLLRRFLEAIHNVRGWNLCISGSDENWCDQTNRLSYDILELVTKLGYQTPNLTVRVHRNTPERLWKMTADCLATGTGLPAIYNDEVVCPALEKTGIPPHHSHEYCMNGCNQIDIMGKSHMGLEDGEVNMGKALELCLYNGYDFHGELLSESFGSPEECADFEEFLSLYYKQLDYVIKAACKMSNISQEVYAKYAPNPLRSCLIEGCLEKGLDYKDGGPLYGHGQILAEGVADTADSLYAIKKLVYDEKKYKIGELINALKADFTGFEKLYRDFSSCEKFGNDIPSVDRIAAEIMSHYCKVLKTVPTYRGGHFTGGCSPYNRAAENGAAVGALPNGKRSGEATYADSIAATPGRDTNGPTASINSMLSYDQSEACSGFVAQMKFQKSLFNTEKGKESFICLAKVYFAGGGQQLSVNVLDRDALIEAQKNPDKYRGLFVRVGGFSEYFCNLSPELQQNIIDRTDFAV